MRLLSLMGILVLTLGISCAQDDGNPTEINVDQSEVEKIIADARNGLYGNIHSLLIYQNDQLLAEEYFGGYDADSIHFQYSVTKSVASLLVGIAIDKGLLSSTSEKLYQLFPEYEGQIANWSSLKGDMTVKDVLTMSAGFQWDEWTYTYTDTRNDANKLIRSNDLMKYVLDLPMAFTPGTRFTYNSGCSMLLSGIVENTTGMTTEAFARENLFYKLGIEEWDWEQGNDQKFNTGWGLHLRPKDMLKIGRLVLDNGKWNGEQIVSAEWLKASSTNHIANYGFQWWLSGNFFSARGWGGQVIGIVPEQNLVVVTTAGDFGGGLPAGIRILNKLVN